MAVAYGLRSGRCAFRGQVISSRELICDMGTHPEPSTEEELADCEFSGEVGGEGPDDVRALDGGSLCRMSIIRNANVALLILRKGRVPLLILRKDHVACH